MTDPSGRPERAEAVRIIRMLAKARLVTLAARVQISLDELGMDRDDVLACLAALRLGDLQKDEPDQKFPDKRAFVFHPTYGDRRLYVKMSLRMPKDHDLVVLSFKVPES
jgi:hypothetical protein